MKYCKNGHARTEENTYKSPLGAIACRVCRRQSQALRNTNPTKWDGLPLDKKQPRTNQAKWGQLQ